MVRQEGGGGGGGGGGVQKRDRIVNHCKQVLITETS